MILNLSRLAVLLPCILLYTLPTLAAPSRLQDSVAFTPQEDALHIDAEGNLQGDLKNRRSQQIRMHSRQSPSLGFNYATKKVRGVNLGGWLVAEPWITPSLFDDTGDSRVIDEWTMGKYVSDAATRLESHWKTFITESDIAAIAAANLNHIRIPIGYWAIDSQHGNYIKGSQLSYLKKAVKWARKYNLKVMIDLHGAPGSQNGFDNSGKKGALNWYTKEDYKTRAKTVVETLARTFMGDTDVVTVIELLNEPLTTAGPSNALDFTIDYYNNAYYAVRYPTRTNTQANFAVAIHDGFQSLSTWANRYPEPTYQEVILDTHIYSVFNQWQVALTQSDRAKSYCNMRSSIATSNQHLYTVVGEWTMAPTDCAKYLNGRGVGARYNGKYPGSTRVGTCTGMSGTGASFSTSYKSYLKNMFDTQRNVYESGTGWIMWTWKTEQAADWDYQRGLKYGYITKNLDSKGSVSC